MAIKITKEDCDRARLRGDKIIYLDAGDHYVDNNVDLTGLTLQGVGDATKVRWRDGESK